jgi:hypothetical protein
MKTISKLLFAGTALAAAGAANAQISVLPTASTGSDLVLFVTDTVTGASFVQDLGVTVNSLGVTTASVVADAAAGNENSVNGNDVLGTLSNPVGTNGVDAALAAFLNTNGTANMVFGIEGAASGNGTTQSGQQRLVATFTGTPTAVLAGGSSNGIVGLYNAGPSSAQASGGQSTINTFFIASNSATAKYDFGAGGGLGAASPMGFLSAAALGSTVYFYEISTYSDASGDTDANFYASSTGFTVSATGAISGFSGSTPPPPPPVPLPAAVWLFGSGLIGLFGVGRRRIAAVAA